MIISFTTTTVDARTKEKTYWFTVKLRGHECTALDLGFDKNANFVCASGSVFNLEPEVQQQIIKATAPMVEKVV